MKPTPVNGTDGPHDLLDSLQYVNPIYRKSTSKKFSAVVRTKDRSERRSSTSGSLSEQTQTFRHLASCKVHTRSKSRSRDRGHSQAALQSGQDSTVYSRIGVRICEASLEGQDCSSDLYCRVLVGCGSLPTKRKTRVVSGCAHPKWEEFFLFDDLETLAEGQVTIQLRTRSILNKKTLALRSWQLQELKTMLSDIGSKREAAAPVWFQLDHASSWGKGLVAIRLKVQFHILEQAPTELLMSVGTWNVGNEPPAADLSSWMDTAACDLVVVGSQECSYEARAPASSCHNDWIAALQGMLGERFMLVEAVAMGQMRLVVFASMPLMLGIVSVEAGSQPTGVGHIGTNKGGVAVALRIFDSRVCFVNAHLAAHQDMYQRRNEDFREIVDGIRIGCRDMDLTSQFDHLLFIGDLNYRLEVDGWVERDPSPAVYTKVMTMIQSAQYMDLLRHDQLRRAMATGEAFVGYKEGSFSFPPTFKVERGGPDKWTTKEGWSTQRVPSYCDRILWRSQDSIPLHQISFSASRDITSSDHTPVAAKFRMQVTDLATIRKRSESQAGPRRGSLARSSSFAASTMNRSTSASVSASRPHSASISSPNFASMRAAPILEDEVAEPSSPSVLERVPTLKISEDGDAEAGERAASLRGGGAGATPFKHRTAPRRLLSSLFRLYRLGTGGATPSPPAASASPPPLSHSTSSLPRPRSASQEQARVAMLETGRGHPSSSEPARMPSFRHGAEGGAQRRLSWFGSMLARGKGPERPLAALGTGEWCIEVRRLGASDLLAKDMISGGSDPYVTFLGPALKQRHSTPPCRRTVHPEWRDKLPVLRLHAQCLQEVMVTMLLVLVMDHDAFLSDDELGSCSIPLHHLITDVPPMEPWDFQVPLLRCGVPAGVLYGELVLVIP